MSTSSSTVHLIIWSIGIVIFAVYFATISPSIAGGDSGEIVAEGCQLGTAHPPGYPLMTLIVYALAQLTFYEGNNVALRVNIFCAACTALAAVFMAYMVVQLSPKQKETSFLLSVMPGIIVTMCVFAFSPLIWQYAITAEVFPLNTFFASWILYLVVIYSQKRKVEIAYFGAFVCGLALCNQHTILLYEGPLVLWILFTLRNLILQDYMIFVKLSVAFIVGFSPYLYLPIAATIAPKAGSWGHVTTWTGFLHHFLRKDYGTFQLFSGAAGKKTEGFAARNMAYLSDVQNYQGLHFSLYIALIGIVISVLYWLQKSHEYGLSVPKDSTSTSINPSEIMISPGKGKKGSKTPVPKPIHDNSSMKAKAEINPDECRWTPFLLLLTQLVYFGVFHTLANLPLADKLLFGVHQRFWMQPNVLLFTWVGIGFNSLVHVMKFLMDLFLSSNKKGSNKKSSTSSDNASTGSSGESLSAVFHAVRFALVFVALGLSYLQFTTWYDISNQQNADYFKRYASAILSPLPENAVLLINYDQQWTSVRYMQLCEGFRKDVTSLQLSMMTYKWFQYKHDLYQYPLESGRKNLTFPGTFTTHSKSPLLTTENAFTLHMFLDANYDDHEIFLGGKINYPDEEMMKVYDSVPYGMVSKFMKIKDVPKGDVYAEMVKKSWTSVKNHLVTFPDVKKYPEETWEWTIYRDYRDRVSDTAAFLLLTAIEIANTNPAPLINAMYWLESANLLEEGKGPTALLKNVGLAHVHLVQNKVLTVNDTLTDFMEGDLLQTKDKLDFPLPNTNWREWSAQKFLQHWGEFLKRPDASRDPQYQVIDSMYKKATMKTTTKQTAQDINQQRKQQSGVNEIKKG